MRTTTNLTELKNRWVDILRSKAEYEHNARKNKEVVTSPDIDDIVQSNIDREIKNFLDVYKLPYDRNELRLNGYHLIIEETGDLTERKYKVLLCEVKDVKRFTIKTSITL